MNQDVWVRDKGIHYEDIPRKHPETFPELNERCYATFGIKIAIPFNSRFGL